jgi:hypothetical protein
VRYKVQGLRANVRPVDRSTGEHVERGVIS